VSFTAIVLLVAIATSAAGFVAMRLRLGALPPSYAPARGSSAAGVAYAFTVAFAPWAKESASRHLPSYLAGIAYHAAVFAALARLVLSLFGPPALSLLDAATAAALAPGLLCGVGLLVKRCVDARLRALSVPEDFFVNGLVDAVLAAGLVASLRPAALPVFQLAGALLIVYAPLGKVRHMLFLFTSRRALGAFFGRRGVRPSARARGVLGV